jgi:cytochrome c-type protein NapC
MTKLFSLGGILIFIGGIVFAGIFGFTLEYTNTTEFCTSCHSMKTNLNELKETVHHKSASGVAPGCADCHVPRSLGPKLWAKFMAAKDVYHEIMGTIDTPEKYEARRWDMANRVWAKMKASNSRECRDCHSFDSMDFDEQAGPTSKKHQKAMTDEGQTCIDCHKGIAHEEPDEPEVPEAPAEGTKT